MDTNNNGSTGATSLRNEAMTYNQSVAKELQADELPKKTYSEQEYKIVEDELKHYELDENQNWVRKKEQDHMVNMEEMEKRHLSQEAMEREMAENKLMLEEIRKLQENKLSPVLGNGIDLDEIEQRVMSGNVADISTVREDLIEAQNYILDKEDHTYKTRPPVPGMSI